MSTHTRFNRPAVMFARIIYVAHMAAGVAGLAAVVGAMWGGGPRYWIWGGSFLSAAWAGRDYLRRSRTLASCERSLDRFMESPGDSPVADTPEGEEFEELLERRDSLESRRGTAGFDPWEILVLQREIDASLRAHPELESLLKAHDTP